jgi:hypothetical protein
VEKLLTPSQLPEILGVRPGTIYSWLFRGIGIAQDFDVSKMAVTIAFPQLKKEGLLTSKRGIGSFVV